MSNVSVPDRRVREGAVAGLGALLLTASSPPPARASGASPLPATAPDSLLAAQRRHRDHPDADPRTEGERDRRAFRPDSSLRVPRLAPDPEPTPPRACPSRLRRSLQRPSARTARSTSRRPTPRCSNSDSPSQPRRHPSSAATVSADSSMNTASPREPSLRTPHDVRPWGCLPVDLFVVQPDCLDTEASCGVICGSLDPQETKGHVNYSQAAPVVDRLVRTTSPTDPEAACVTPPVAREGGHLRLRWLGLPSGNGSVSGRDNYRHKHRERQN
jgi:hypothetical protein